MAAGHRRAISDQDAARRKPTFQAGAQTFRTHMAFLRDPQPGHHRIGQRWLEPPKLGSRERLRLTPRGERAPLEIVERRSHCRFSQEREQQPGAVHLERRAIGDERVEGLHDLIGEKPPGLPARTKVLRIAVSPECPEPGSQSSHGAGVDVQRAVTAEQPEHRRPSQPRRGQRLSQGRYDPPRVTLRAARAGLERVEHGDLFALRAESVRAGEANDAAADDDSSAHAQMSRVRRGSRRLGIMAAPVGGSAPDLLGDAEVVAAEEFGQRAGGISGRERFADLGQL